MSKNAIDAKRLIIPGLAGLYEALAPYGYPFMRFCIGAILVPHGYAKLFLGGIDGVAGIMSSSGLGLATALAYGIGVFELLGGIMLAIGLITRPIALLIALEKAVAVFGVYWSNGFFWTNSGYEYPLMWGLMCLVIAIRGGGRLSVDGAIGKEL